MPGTPPAELVSVTPHDVVFSDVLIGLNQRRFSIYFDHNIYARANVGATVQSAHHAMRSTWSLRVQLCTAGRTQQVQWRSDGLTLRSRSRRLIGFTLGVVSVV